MVSYLTDRYSSSATFSRSHNLNRGCPWLAWPADGLKNGLFFFEVICHFRSPLQPFWVAVWGESFSNTAQEGALPLKSTDIQLTRNQVWWSKPPRHLLRCLWAQTCTLSPHCFMVECLPLHPVSPSPAPLPRNPASQGYFLVSRTINGCRSFWIFLGKKKYKNTLQKKKQFYFNVFWVKTFKFSLHTFF